MPARLMVADSERDAKCSMPRACFGAGSFIGSQRGAKSYAVMSDLEIDRAAKKRRWTGAFAVALSEQLKLAGVNIAPRRHPEPGSPEFRVAAWKSADFPIGLRGNCAAFALSSR